MSAKFLTWTYVWRWSYGRTCSLNFNVLFDPNAKETKQIIKSFIKRPSNKEAFGDKEVVHRRMIITPKPIVPDAPESLATSIQYDVSGVGVDCTSAGSVNEWTCKALEHTNDMPSIEREWRTEMETSAYYVTLWGKGRQRWYNQSTHTWGDWSEWTNNPVYYIARYNRISGIFDYGGYFRPISEVEYEASLPPGSWLEIMDSRRPFAVSDSEALSEVVRRTITEQTSLDTNNIANVLEIVNLIKSIYTGDIGNFLNDIKDIKDSLRLAASTKGLTKAKYSYNAFKGISKEAGNAWLAYRYAYSTTKSDIERQVIAAENQLLGSLDKKRVLRGHIPVTNGIMRVKMRLHDKVSPNFMKFEIRAHQKGMFPGPYELWDILPFSFVGDWFAPLGDYLNDIEEYFLYQNYYQVDELLVSKKQTLTVSEPWGVTEYLWYDRYLLDELPQFEIYEDPQGPKKKTIVKRTLDALSLVVGTWR